jgi:hypothetical protein
MRRTVRIVLLWLLIVALPMQGFAAVLNLSCTTHHDVSIALTMAHENHADDASHTRHCHSATDQNAGTDTPADHSAMHKNLPCSACGVYCASMVMLSATLKITPLTASTLTLAIPVDLPFTGFIPSGLERPPRIISA